MTADVTIDMDKMCVECGKAGATPSGICLRCVMKAVGNSSMKSKVGQKMQIALHHQLGVKL